jgi:predicted transposase YbfD/YdcC
MKEEWVYDHGRYETRICIVLPAKENLTETIIQNWEGSETMVRVEASRMIKNKITKETRYYISDENVENPTYFNKLVRGHWSIENQLYWYLDSDRRCCGNF